MSVSPGYSWGNQARLHHFLGYVFSRQGVESSEVYQIEVLLG